MKKKLYQVQLIFYLYSRVYAAKEVDFVAVDEIQMCADRERGHIFTERLLNARGLKLTCSWALKLWQGLLII